MVETLGKHVMVFIPGVPTTTIPSFSGMFDGFHAMRINCQNSCYKTFLHRKDVRFVFTSSCLWKGSYLIYAICVCFHIVVYMSNTYFTVFLFCFSSSCVPYCCQFLSIVHFLWPLRYSLMFIYYFV